MRQMLKALVLSFAFLFPTSLFAEEVPEEVTNFVLDVSYLVETPNALGSCTVFAKGDRNFAWTAAHVVAGQYRTKVVFVDGEEKEIPYFDPVYVVKQKVVDGKIVGYEHTEAKVLVVDFARDIALLVLKNKLTDRKVSFLDKEPKVGDWLVHGGSRWGYYGIRSVTSGNLAQIGTFLDDFPELPYDLVTTPASPGSSGGGVFDAESKAYVGMVVRGGESTFIFIVPSRDIVEWAVKHDLAWAVLDSAKAPSDEELEKVFPVVGLVPTEEMLMSMKSRTLQPGGWRYLTDKPLGIAKAEAPPTPVSSQKQEATPEDTWDNWRTLAYLLVACLAVGFIWRIAMKD